MSKTQCEICGSPSEHWADINDYPHFFCKSCVHVFVYPRPSQLVLDQFYADGQYYEAAQAQRERLTRDARDRLDRLASLCRRFELPARLLDVGCASGIFLTEATRKGWLAEGSERSVTTAAQARVLSTSTIHCGILEEVDISTGPFPVVTAWEVIEHATKPGEFLAALVRQVQPGGLIALSTPLIDGLPALVMGVKFPMLVPPEHLSLFSRKSLSILASAHGLREVSYRSFSNLDARSMASGLSRKLLHRELHENPPFARAVMNFAGITLAWMPYIIDKLGLGTEMEVIYRRKMV